MRRAFAPLLASLLLAPAGAARAGGAAELEQGIKAYEHGELDRAEGLLRAAASRPGTQKQRARAWLYLGLTQAAAKDIAAARRSFRAALVDDPEIAPEPERVSPQIVLEFNEVRRGVQGQLVIDAGEPRARVFIDGQERGRAPLTLELGVGRHHVRILSADTLRLHEAGVLVRAGAAARLAVRLAPRRGFVRLALEPANAQVYEGPARLAPGPLLELPAGPHRLTVRREGFREESHPVLVVPEQTVTLTVRLVAAPRRAWYVRRRPWGFVAAGVAVGAGVTGLLVGSAIAGRRDRLQLEQRNRTLTYPHFQELSSSIESSARAANILLGVAGGAAVGALILMLLPERGDAGAGRAWRVVPAMGGAALAGRF